MTKALLPQAFWFRIAASCPRLDEMPRPDGRQRLLDLPASCALPDGAATGGACVRGPRSASRGILAAWGSPCMAEGLSDPQLAPDRPEGFADVQLWVDTRDTRDVSRATRFCHRFAASLRLAMPGRKLEVEVVQRPIARAVADAPMSQAGLIESARRARPRPAGSLEVFLPAQALNGFDPETNRRLGFRLPGRRPRPRRPVPGRRPRLPNRREPQPLVHPRAAGLSLRDGIGNDVGSPEEIREQILRAGPLLLW